MMTEPSYLHHLTFLKHLYPDSIYYCHPKERSLNPERIFGSEHVVRPNEPVEAYLRKRGIPCRLVGVCSSSLLVLAIGNEKSVAVDLIQIDIASFDGHKADIVENLKKPIRGVQKISVDDLQRFLIERLHAVSIPLKLIGQPRRDIHHH